MKFCLRDGTERVPEEVRYVPSLKQNLISFGELENKGCMFKGEKGVLKVLMGSMVVIKAMRKNGICALEYVMASGSMSCQRLRYGVVG